MHLAALSENYLNKLYRLNKRELFELGIIDKYGLIVMWLLGC